MLASPKRMIFSLPPSQALTTDFLPPRTSLRGLLHFSESLAIFEAFAAFLRLDIIQRMLQSPFRFLCRSPYHNLSQLLEIDQNNFLVL